MLAGAAEPVLPDLLRKYNRWLELFQRRKTPVENALRTKVSVLSPPPATLHSRFAVAARGELSQRSDRRWLTAGALSRLKPSDTDPLALPYAVITLDGKADDWEGIEPIIEDGADVGRTGADIARIYAARSDTFLYFRMDLTNATDAAAGIEYFFDFRPDDIKNNRHFVKGWKNGSTTLAVIGKQLEGGKWQDKGAPGHSAIQKIIECKYPLSWLPESSTIYISGRTRDIKKRNTIDSTKTEASMLAGPALLLGK